MLEHAGRNVRRIRREREMTQAQLARLAKITQQQLSAYENGLQMPLGLIERLARILAVHPNELLKETKPVSPSVNDGQTEAAIRRLTAAIAKGGELNALVAALDTHERKRKEIVARLDALWAPKPTLDRAAVNSKLESYLADWQGLLRGHVEQARQIVQRLVKGH